MRVNVFEANIRLLGGLLSAHMLAQDPVHGPRLMPEGVYSGGLLDLALDLGKRLLPAFTASPTGKKSHHYAPQIRPKYNLTVPVSLKLVHVQL